MKIIIVEDEIRIREGIIKLINRLDKDYIVIGEADNGQEGLELITRLRPDLIISDIKMPLMDGMEMLQELVSRGIKHKTILLSAYSEFAYAQHAIKLGVKEYLLKPISVGDFEQSLSNIESELREEKISHFEYTKAVGSLESILYNILLSSMQVNEEVSTYLYQNCQLDIEGEFGLIVFYLGGKYDEDKFKVRNMLDKKLNEKHNTRYCIFELPKKNALVVVLFNFINVQQIERWAQNTLLLDMCQLTRRGTVCGWIVFQSLAKMKESLDMLQNELHWAIVLGEDVMISYPKITHVKTAAFQYPISIESRMKSALCKFDYEELKIIYNEFFAYCKKDLYLPSAIKEAFTRLSWSIMSTIREIDYHIYENLKQQEILESISNAIVWDELKDALWKLLENVEKTTRTKQEATSLVVIKAKSLIDEFYKDGITLEEIAVKLKITPEYLGTLFHKELGISFSIYIKNYRMQKAKEMLIGTELKLYEIADLLGYNDSKYFARVFKEETGQSPAEYRKLNK
ncbi:MAG: putative response regulatory protein [Clostridia bacterium]|jgi:two-component system response regulator YesN|nr:putative response regulatory protein [Clostridia bacterium]